MAKRNGSTRAWRGVRARVLAAKVASGDHRCECGCDEYIDFTQRGAHPAAPAVDHIVAVDEGGTDDLWNLRSVRFGHNSKLENARRRARGLDTRARPKRGRGLNAGRFEGPTVQSRDW